MEEIVIPVNDVALVEVERNQYEVSGIKLIGGDSKETVESGILTAMPEKLLYLGFHSFAFEDSLGTDVLEKVWDYYSALVGKRVYWTALSDRGSVLEVGGKTYALIKLTDFIAQSEPSVKAKNIATGRMNI